MNQIEKMLIFAAIIAEEAKNEKTCGELSVNFWRKCALEIADEYKTLAVEYKDAKTRRETMWNRLTQPCAPVYYIRDETDCDHYRVISAHKAPSYYAYLLDIERAHRGAEGPVSIIEVSELEYNSFETDHRDEAAEAANY